MRKDFGPQSQLFPMPVLIIGTYDENGKPNAMNAAWGAIYDNNQVTISLSDHVTTRNIRKNKAFTVSLATEETLIASDYVGIVSQAKDPDKMKKSGLKAFKSKYVNAPLFEQYPVTLECELISLDGQEGEGGTLIGQIVNVSADEKVLTNGKVDIEKLDAIAYDPFTHKYVLCNQVVGSAFKDGMKLK